MSQPDSESIVVTHRGKPLRFAPCGGTVERKLRANQWYEGELLQYIEALALPGAYVDVGGYVGTHALFFAVHCPSSRVHTFEPRSNCHRLLARNIEANDLGGKIELRQLGLSDRDETVTVRLDNRDEVFDCKRLDDVISEPVSVMKLDVEGMEARVLAGAERILREHRPLIFAEANSDEELRALVAVLEPHGYRLTGRIFNDSPTYELAVASGPTGIEALPATRSLMDSRLWVSDEAAVRASISDGKLRVHSTLPAGGSGHVTQPPTRLRQPPASELLAVPRGSTWFVDVDAEPPQGVEVSVFVMEYAGRERVEVGRHRIRRRMMAQLVLGPETDAIRVAFKMTGPGDLLVDRVALHGPIGGSRAASGSKPRSRLARLRAAIFGVLGVLLLANVFNLGRNAESRPHRTQPKSMFAIARDSPYWSVRGTFAVYDYLRRRLAGDRQLTIPPHLAQHSWYLERQAHLRVVTADAPIELAERAFRVLRSRADRTMYLRTERRNDELLMLFDGETNEYVIARQQGGNALILLPEPMYRSLIERR